MSRWPLMEGLFSVLSTPRGEWVAMRVHGAEVWLFRDDWQEARVRSELVPGEAGRPGVTLWCVYLRASGRVGEANTIDDALELAVAELERAARAPEVNVAITESPLQEAGS